MSFLLRHLITPAPPPAPDGDVARVSAISYPPSSSSGRRRSSRSARQPASWWWRCGGGVDRNGRRKRLRGNPIAALCSALAAALLVAALANSKWITLKGSECPRDYVGAPLFFTPNVFSAKAVADHGGDQLINHYTYYTNGLELKDCVDPPTANAFYALIGLCLATVLVDLVAFLLDAIGPRRGFLKWLRQRVVFQICAVMLCCVVTGVTCYAAYLEDHYQHRVSRRPAAVDVGFGEGFYLVFASGVCSIASVAYSLSRTLSQLRQRMATESDRTRLLLGVGDGGSDASSPAGGRSGGQRRHRRSPHHHQQRRHRRGLVASAGASSHPADADHRPGGDDGAFSHERRSGESAGRATAAFYEHYLMGDVEEDRDVTAGEDESDDTQLVIDELAAADRRQMTSPGQTSRRVGGVVVDEAPPSPPMPMVLPPNGDGQGVPPPPYVP